MAHERPLIIITFGITLISLGILFNYRGSDNNNNVLVKTVKDRTKALIQESSHGKAEWTDLLKCQKIRINRLQERCKELGLIPDKPLQEMDEFQLKKLVMKFISDDKHHVLLRSFPKTGCTSWKTLIMNNTKHYMPWIDTLPGPHEWNDFRDKLGLYTLSAYNKAAVVFRLKTYFTILTVRHPLARLESTFTDKKLGHNKLLAEVEKNDKDNFLNASMNIFQKMVNNLQKEGHHNRHSASYTAMTNPCIFPVSFIGKTETADTEMKYIIQEKLAKAGGPIRENISRKLQDKPNTQKYPGEIYLEFFSKLKDPEQDIKNMMKMYKTDMYLFGYDYEIRQDGVYAFCENYEFNGKCC